MTENGSPDKLPSSREGGEDPENHLEQAVKVQKAPDRPQQLQTAVRNHQKSKNGLQNSPKMHVSQIARRAPELSCKKSDIRIPSGVRWWHLEGPTRAINGLNGRVPNAIFQQAPPRGAVERPQGRPAGAGRAPPAPAAGSPPAAPGSAPPRGSPAAPICASFFCDCPCVRRAPICASFFCARERLL